jgi:hypothetical protein
MSPRQFRRQKSIEQEKHLNCTVRKHLSADALIATVRGAFEQVPDSRKGKPAIPMADALMSAYAMFCLKDPSILAFEKQWKEDDSNLRSIYKLGTIPSDTQMRTILDPLPPEELRPVHNDILRDLQRGKGLEKMRYLEEGYLLLVDGTECFKSQKLSSPICLEKNNSETGKTTYHLQMLGAALANPELREVIPLIPEAISKQDGQSKNDCEMHASRRLLIAFQREHPHLEIVVCQDAISPNGPYIKFLKELGYHFILSVKEADHTHLFARFDAAIKNKQAQEMTLNDPEKKDTFHHFRWMNGLPINGSHQDVLVNVLEYWEVRGEKIQRFCWVTDIPIEAENVYRLMRAGRARWKIENETFNTLKNQGYHLEHNYGLGEKYLAIVFMKLMMLAFLTDQVQQLCCGLFRSAWQKAGSKRALWEKVRALFNCFKLRSMEILYLAILHGHVRCEPIIEPDSS